MQSKIRFLKLSKQGTRLILLAAMLLALVLRPTVATSAAGLGAPVSIDLCATTGSVTMPNGASVTIWGYVPGDCSTPVPAQLPGPVIDVNVGDNVTVTLHNNLSEATSLLFQGMSIAPDLVGVAAGAMKSYSFTPTEPGTYLYEAGLTVNGQHQVAMGLYGALIVRPATAGQAYDTAFSAYNDEAVLVLSEIDPALNLNPASFDMRNYAPRYFLINGLAYPNTVAIDTLAGNRVLLRYVNAGIQYHSMALLGARQDVVGLDGNGLAYSHQMVAETIGPGQTLDAIATVPASAVDGSKFAIYDGNLMLRNSNAAGVGGMLTFLAVGTATGGGDTTGPATSGMALSPNPTNGSVSVALSASVSDVATGGSNVTAAEYFIDAVGANTTGTAMSGTFGSPTAAVSATLTTAQLALLASGSHTIYVHGQDSAGNWGSTNFAVLTLDKAGPASTGLTLNPNPTNGSVDVALHATGNDSASGGAAVASASYTIDGGSPQSMTVTPAGAPVASLDATIPAATVNGLLEGAHVIAVTSTDAFGNNGAAATIDLVVDKTGPATSGVSAAPNPNNGALPLNPDLLVVRLSATVADSASNIGAAEGFIDTVGANGSGFVMVATDGAFNSLSEAVYGDIPLTTIVQLSAGAHTLYAHGKDAAGNWGAISSTVLTIDKTAPLILSINRVDPSPISAASVNFLVSFSEAVTGVTSANFTPIMGGGLSGAAVTSVTGSGATRTVTVSTGTGGGTLGLNLTSRTGITDVAGNALSQTGVPFVGQVYTLLTPPLYFSTSGSTNPPGVGGTADDADIYLWNGAAFSRSIDASTLGLPGSANVDGFDRVDATHFFLSFSGATAVPGLGTVQDEDVVYYNAGTWVLAFDGSTHGLAATDLDAINIVGTTLYFSTDNTTVPPGVGGGGDDADIYSWNGTSFARVRDASALGWSTANVDGLVWVDANHVYLSYSANTGVPGLGTVQDEDVVYYNAGTWSVYFDGTSKGLTNNNQDVDAFDLP